MEEQENIPYTDPEEPNRAATGERPSWLMVLCILTFISSGISCLGYFLFTGIYSSLPMIMALPSI